MEQASVNLFAVVGAAIAGFFVGGAWYSPMLMGKVWMTAAGVSKETLAEGDKRKIYGAALVALLIMSYCLAAFIASPGAQLVSAEFFNSSQQGAFYGMLAGLGWISCAFVVVGLFEHRPWQYMAVNGGYWIVTMTVMGGIIGAWP